MSNSLIAIQLIIIILKLFTDTAMTDTSSMTTDLEIICGFVNGTDIIHSPPTECTSIAIATNNRDQLNAISSIKGKLPLFLVDQTNTFDAWPDTLKQGAIDYLKDMKSLGINYIAFDNTYKDKENVTLDRESFSKDLAKFLDDAKKQYPDVGFGLVITIYMDWLKESLDIGLLKDHVDFFFLDSVEYRFCNHEKHQADMTVSATKDDIIGSLAELRNLEVDVGKLIYSIDLVVRSVYGDILQIAYEHENMSYLTLCSKKMSKRRKYCFSSIQNLFDTARLHITEKTLGIYVRGTDYDDTDGKCGCTTKDDPSAAFRGLKTIAGASREDKNNVSFYDCAQGHFPVIIH